MRVWPATWNMNLPQTLQAIIAFMSERYIPQPGGCLSIAGCSLRKMPGGILGQGVLSGGGAAENPQTDGDSGLIGFGFRGAG